MKAWTVEKANLSAADVKPLLVEYCDTFGIRTAVDLRQMLAALEGAAREIRVELKARTSPEFAAFADELVKS